MQQILTLQHYKTGHLSASSTLNRVTFFQNQKDFHIFIMLHHSEVRGIRTARRGSPVTNSSNWKSHIWMHWWWNSEPISTPVFRIPIWTIAKADTDPCGCLLHKFEPLFCQKERHIHSTLFILKVDFTETIKICFPTKLKFCRLVFIIHLFYFMMLR